MPAAKKTKAAADRLIETGLAADAPRTRLNPPVDVLVAWLARNGHPGIDPRALEDELRARGFRFIWSKPLDDDEDGLVQIVADHPLVGGDIEELLAAALTEDELAGRLAGLDDDDGIDGEAGEQFYDFWEFAAEQAAEFLETMAEKAQAEGAGAAEAADIVRIVPLKAAFDRFVRGLLRGSLAEHGLAELLGAVDEPDAFDCFAHEFANLGYYFRFRADGSVLALTEEMLDLPDDEFARHRVWNFEFLDGEAGGGTARDRYERKRAARKR